MVGSGATPSLCLPALLEDRIAGLRHRRQPVRLGPKPHTYPGRSRIISPRGEVLADAGDGEGVVKADLDLPALQAYRREFPALLDQRDWPT